MGTDCSAEHGYGHFHICTENPLSLHCGKYGNKESCTRVAGYQRTAGSKNTDRSLSMVRWQWPFNQLQGLEPTACRDSPRNRTLRNRRETRSIEKDITANIVDDTLRVNVTVNGQTLTLKAKITYPAGKGPFPAIIGIGRGTGSLPPTIFTSRNIAQIAFNFTQVMSHTQKRGNEPINKLYPDRTDMGAYCAWSWGVSRIIDGLEIVGKKSKIDTKRLAISGCSFAGKMALFAGAFDERIALTIAQEPGGGGAAAWRVSETLGEVETLGRTSHAWFKESMFQYKEDNVSKLPYDHHELCAMVAPRALLVLGNPDYVWLADESGYVSCRAARKVWETFGIADRMGFSIVGGHGHCQLPESQYPEVEAFVDKFLLGKKDANTEVTIAPLYEKVDYERWLFH